MYIYIYIFFSLFPVCPLHPYQENPQWRARPLTLSVTPSSSPPTSTKQCHLKWHREHTCSGALGLERHHKTIPSRAHTRRSFRGYISVPSTFHCNNQKKKNRSWIALPLTYGWFSFNHVVFNQNCSAFWLNYQISVISQ